jgi:hypothetical protein
MMTISQTAAASVGRLGLAAAAFGRPTFVGVGAGERPGAAGGPTEAAGGARLGDSLYELLVNAAVATGWLSERRTLHGRSLDKEATVMVTTKDVLIAGTVLTGVAALAGKVVPRREPSSGRPVSEGDEASPYAADGADGDRPYVRTMTELNHTFALLGVAATPFINFALFDSYHPHPLRSFFSLW